MISDFLHFWYRHEFLFLCEHPISYSNSNWDLNWVLQRGENWLPNVSIKLDERQKSLSLGKIINPKYALVWMRAIEVLMLHKNIFKHTNSSNLFVLVSFFVIFIPTWGFFLQFDEHIFKKGVGWFNDSRNLPISDFGGCQFDNGLMKVWGFWKSNWQTPIVIFVYEWRLQGGPLRSL